MEAFLQPGDCGDSRTGHIGTHERGDRQLQRDTQSFSGMLALAFLISLLIHWQNETERKKWSVSAGNN